VSSIFSSGKSTLAGWLCMSQGLSAEIQYVNSASRGYRTQYALRIAILIYCGDLGLENLLY